MDICTGIDDDAPDSPSADDAWLTPWLNWLEAVENRSGIRDFGLGEKGEHTLEHLHEMFTLDATPEAGAEWLTAHIETGAPL